jgi:hypothetical protein
MRWVLAANNLYFYTDNLCKKEPTKRSIFSQFKRKQMTYNQVKKTIKELLQSHAMLRTVEMVRPQEWLNRTEAAEFPAAFFWVNTGTLNKGHDNDYTITFWFYDKAGMEYLYECDVVSDMLGVANDVVNKLRLGSNPYLVPDTVNYNVVSDSSEDYLAGVTFNIDFKTFSNFDSCDFPS